MNIVVDCNPGTDDAVALALALSQQGRVNVEAITVVDGHVPLNKAVANLAIALKQFERTNIPVYKGCPKPLIGFDKVELPPSLHITGESGFGILRPKGHEVVEMNLVANKSAAEGLVDLARRFAGKLHVISLGPLTNIAMAIRLDANFPRNLASLCIMGGDYGTAFKRYGGEFNFCKDPEAANIVLREAVGFCPVTLVPYDTCFWSTENCHWDWFDAVAQDSTEFGRFIRKLYVPYRNNVKHFASTSSIAMVAFLFPNAIEQSKDFTPPCGVRLDFSVEPAKTEDCPGGQRGCLVLQKPISDSSSDSSEDSPEASAAPMSIFSFGLRVATRVNEHMFKTTFAEAMGFFSKKALPHYGY